MRIVQGLAVKDEQEFLSVNIQNALANGVDDVVVLDDASDPPLKVPSGVFLVRQEVNSYKTGVNRYKVLSEACAELNPDWIILRAADNLYQSNIREEIERLPKEINVLAWRIKNLWRSKDWYRVDGFWGGQLRVPHACGFRYQSDWAYDGDWAISYCHGSKDFPRMPFKEVYTLASPLIHYGMSSSCLIRDKFNYYASVARNYPEQVKGMSIEIPPVREWRNFNGYKVAAEEGMHLLPTGVDAKLPDLEPLDFTAEIFWNEYLDYYTNTVLPSIITGDYIAD